MECNVYDETLSRIAIVTNFVSMKWEEHYSDVGSFYIVVNKDKEALSLFKIGHFVGVRPYDTLMYIYSVEDKDGQIWAHGAEAKHLLKTRIYDGRIVCQNVEKTLKDAVMDSRPLPIFGITENKGLTATLDSQRSYSSLFDLSKTWCDMAEYGFRFKHDRTNKKLLYDVYAGMERNNEVFAEKFKNFYNFTRTVSDKQVANVAIVLGQGEGEARKKVVVGDTESSGFDRSEIYIDARDLAQEEGQTDEEYLEKLRARGLEKLKNNQKIDEIDFEIAPEGLNKDFFLGDIVTCLLPEYGLAAKIRISGFSTTYEGNVATTKLALGVPILRSVV